MAAGLVVAASATFVATARAALGYQPDATTPSFSIQGEQPQGVAVDQTSGQVYVAIPTRNFGVEYGQVDQFSSSGVPTAASPFLSGSDSIFTGVAVNPITHGIYASEMVISSPLGVFGTSRMDQFSSAGTLGTVFATSNGTNISPKIAADTNGNVFYPNSTADVVQVFNSSGSLIETISCGGCPGGPFAQPSVVAVDSADNLYVVDIEDGRVLKFTHSGGPYTYSSLLQSGHDAAAVAVDTSDNSVFVGSYPPEGEYHIVAYNSSGTQFDDFGATLFAAPPLGAASAGQIAVNTTTHKLYVSDSGAKKVNVFARVTISPPTVATNAASPVGQVAATLKATVNANFHATLDCHFEYVEDADFQATVYANATDVPCSSMPVGSQGTPVTASLSSLPPNTTYHYRAVAANNAGSVNGGNQEFTTLPLVAPTVTTGAPSEVKQTIAKVTGKVNPHGGAVTDCHFEYGKDLSYGTSKPCSTPVGEVTSDVSQTVQLSGLAPSTTYHYRLSVTSNAGPSQGSDMQFTTATPTPTPTPPTPSPTPQPGATPTLPGPVVQPKKLICKKGFRKAKVRGKLKCVKKKRKPRHH